MLLPTLLHLVLLIKWLYSVTIPCTQTMSYCVLPCLHLWTCATTIITVAVIYTIFDCVLLSVDWFGCGLISHLQAFVDSGAQSTIISKSCAERCGCDYNLNQLSYLFFLSVIHSFCCILIKKHKCWNDNLSSMVKFYDLKSINKSLRLTRNEMYSLQFVVGWRSSYHIF